MKKRFGNIRIYSSFKIENATTGIGIGSAIPEPEEVKPTPTSAPNKADKDDTPKTGSVEIINYIVITTFLSAIGIITVRKYDK